MVSKDAQSQGIQVQTTPQATPDIDPSGMVCAADLLLCRLDSLGHYMKNGTMFAGLERYEDEEFFEKYPTIRFDRLYEQREYYHTENGRFVVVAKRISG